MHEGRTANCTPAVATQKSLVVALFLLTVTATLSAESVEVATAGAHYRGERTESGGAVFRGIRYAAPPTGERRWQPPQSPPPDSGVVEALEFGAACPQPPSPTAGDMATSEDCLFLNVWTPATGGQAPVVVWIHGGGFRSGSSSSQLYDGTAFTADGAVLVSINYRLGALGFLAHPVLTPTAGGVANFGLLDMSAALVWVRDNIAAFGGDPGNVTIFGESAGGMAVQLLMSSPRAASLFHRAYSMSGYGTWQLPRADSHRSVGGVDALALGERILIRAGAEPVATRAELEALPVEHLVAAVEGLHLPVVDGVSLPEEPAAVFEAGRQHDVPFVVGGNSYDGAVMLMAGMEPSEYLESWPAESQRELRNLYRDDFGVDERLAASRMFGDARYLIAARTLAAAMDQVSSPGYLYYFAYVPRSLRTRWAGAPHAVEVAFLFGNESSWSGEVDDEWREVSSRMRSHFLHFARNGDPDDGRYPAWPEYHAEHDTWMVYGDDPVLRSGVLRARLDFFERHYRERRRGLPPLPAE